MLLRQLFDATSSTFTYLLADEQTRDAVLIDPVLEQIERDLELVRELELTLRYALDTHVHADHITAAGTLRERTRCLTVLSERAGTGTPDVLVKEGDEVVFGRHRLRVVETPGHTSGCVTYVCADPAMAFTGDALLIRGCGRTDFQQGDSRTLFRSVHEHLFVLADATFVYPAHDYRGRTVSTIGEEKRHNPRLGAKRTLAEFVDLMGKLALAKPAQIDRALPANLQSGLLQDLPVDATTRPVPTWAPITRSMSGTAEIEGEWVVEHAAEIRIVDVREGEELAGVLGRARDAEFVPLSSLQEAAAGWNRALPVVLICRSGGRSSKGVGVLESLGFERVASVRGGMTRWNALGLPIVQGGAK